MTNANKFTKRGVDYPILDGHRTLPGKYYHDIDIYNEELEKIFYKFWIYACRAEEIPNSGDYKVFNVGDESIIIVRGKDDQIHAHFNVCRHRGTQMCTEPKGNFKGGVIQCPYHAWTYKLTGELQQAPLMKELLIPSKKAAVY